MSNEGTPQPANIAAWITPNLHVETALQALVDGRVRDYDEPITADQIGDWLCTDRSVDRLICDRAYDALERMGLPVDVIDSLMRDDRLMEDLIAAVVRDFAPELPATDDLAAEAQESYYAGIAGGLR